MFEQARLLSQRLGKTNNCRRKGFTICVGRALVSVTQRTGTSTNLYKTVCDQHNFFKFTEQYQLVTSFEDGLWTTWDAVVDRPPRTEE